MDNSRLNNHKSIKYRLLNIVLMCGILLAAVAYGQKKQGYYIDEYYQYTLSNGTQLGIDIVPGKWNDTSRFKGQLVSEGEENFHYGQMYENTANDVHPFLSYMLIHFVSSVFSGVFSKWIGLSVNLILFIPVLLLTGGIAGKLSGNNETVTLLTVALFGLSPATISVVVLIRMYLLLALWTLLYVYIHISDLERDSLSIKKFLIPVFVCGFFGFLTQYFFVVIMFFVSFSYAFYLLVFRRRIRDTFIYGATALASLVCTLLVWRVSIYHIFKGYRGKGAFSQLTDASKWPDRFATHLKYLNTMVFGGTMLLFVIVLLVGLILLVKKCRMIHYKKEMPVMDALSIPTKGFIMVFISSLLSFLVLTQIALIDGITCIRQYYIAYALFLILIPIGSYRTIKAVTGSEKTPTIMTLIFVCGILILGHCQKNVLYLYEEEKAAKEYAADNPDSKVVVFQNDDGMYDTLIQQILLYPRVYCASVNELNTANDKEIASAEELLVYVPRDPDCKEECFETIYKQNDKISQAEHLWDTSVFSAYQLH